MATFHAPRRAGWVAALVGVVVLAAACGIRGAPRPPLPDGSPPPRSNPFALPPRPTPPSTPIPVPDAGTAGDAGTPS